MGSSYADLAGSIPPFTSLEFKDFLDRLVTFRAQYSDQPRKNTYYFSQSGDDATGKGTITSPYKTMAKAQAIHDASASGNLALLFKRGDEWNETTGLTITKANVTVGAYGTGAKPLFSTFSNKLSAGGWTQAGSTNRWTRTINTAVGWVRENYDDVARLSPYGYETSTANVESTPRSWYWASNTLHLNPGVGVDPNNLTFEWCGQINDDGIEVSGDGCLVDNIRCDGWGCAAGQNYTVYPIRSSAASTDNVVLRDCEGFYCSRHSISVNGNGSNTGGFTLIQRCVGGHLNNTTGIGVNTFVGYIPGGGGEVIFESCEARFGTLPYTGYLASAHIGNDSFYGHTASGTINLIVVYNCSTTFPSGYVNATFSAPSAYFDTNGIPGSVGTYSGFRAFVVNYRATGIPSNLYPPYLGFYPKTVYLNCYWQIKAGCTGWPSYIANVATEIVLVNCILDVSEWVEGQYPGRNVFHSGANVDGLLYGCHLRFNGINSGKSWSLLNSGTDGGLKIANSILSRIGAMPVTLVVANSSSQLINNACYQMTGVSGDLGLVTLSSSINPLDPTNKALYGRASTSAVDGVLMEYDREWTLLPSRPPIGPSSDSLSDTYAAAADGVWSQTIRSLTAGVPSTPVAVSRMIDYSASVIHHVYIQRDDGTPYTGLAYNTSGLAGRFVLTDGTLSNAVTFENVSTLGTYQAPVASPGLRFREIDGTNFPGWYEIHFGTIFTGGFDRIVTLQLRGAASMRPCNVQLQMCPPVDLRRIDKNETKTASATLKLKNLLVYNPSGDHAVTFKTDAPGYSGLYCQGNGSGHGIYGQGGNGTLGVPATPGSGIVGISGNAFREGVDTDNGEEWGTGGIRGISIARNSPGITAKGGPGGPGMFIFYDTAGPANHAALKIKATGGGRGIEIEAGASAPETIRMFGGAAGANAINSSALSGLFFTNPPNVDAVRISGDATAADNAEAAFDGTGYGFANCVMPTTTSVTNGVTVAGGSVNANVVSIGGSTTPAGNLASAFNGTGYSFPNCVMPTVTNVSGNIGGNVAGSVNSVVGSVGGAVLGSVGSVLGDVGGSVLGNVEGDVVGQVGAVDGLWSSKLPITAADSTSITIGALADYFADDAIIGAGIFVADGAGLAQTAVVTSNVMATGKLNIHCKAGGGPWKVTPQAGDTVRLQLMAPVAVSRFGLDDILVEKSISLSPNLVNDSGVQLSQINFRQAIALLCSTQAGVASGFGGANPIFRPVAKGASPSRVNATIDGSGRTSVMIRVPD